MYTHFILRPYLYSGVVGVCPTNTLRRATGGCRTLSHDLARVCTHVSVLVCAYVCVSVRMCVCVCVC